MMADVKTHCARYNQPHQPDRHLIPPPATKYRQSQLGCDESKRVTLRTLAKSVNPPVVPHVVA